MKIEAFSVKQTYPEAVLVHAFVASLLGLIDCTREGGKIQDNALLGECFDLMQAYTEKELMRIKYKEPHAAGTRVNDDAGFLMATGIAAFDMALNGIRAERVDKGTADDSDD